MAENNDKTQKPQPGNNSQGDFSDKNPNDIQSSDDDQEDGISLGEQILITLSQMKQVRGSH